MFFWLKKILRIFYHFEWVMKLLLINAYLPKVCLFRKIIIWKYTVSGKDDIFKWRTADHDSLLNSKYFLESCNEFIAQEDVRRKQRGSHLHPVVNRGNCSCQYTSWLNCIHSKPATTPLNEWRACARKIWTNMSHPRNLLEVRDWQIRLSHTQPPCLNCVCTLFSCQVHAGFTYTDNTN